MDKLKTARNEVVMNELQKLKSHSAVSNRRDSSDHYRKNGNSKAREQKKDDDGASEGHLEILYEDTHGNGSTASTTGGKQ